MFLSSLAAYVKGIKNPPLAALERLNNLMALSNNTNALLFPIEIKSKIWANMPPEELEKSIGSIKTLHELRAEDLNVAQKRILTSIVISRAPKCLLYGSNNSIRKDIYRMFDNLDAALAA